MFRTMSISESSRIIFSNSVAERMRSFEKEVFQ